MRADKQLLLARLIHDHLVQLDDVLSDVVERGEPLSPLEAQLIRESAVARLVPVETELRRSSRTVRQRARRLAGRAKARAISWIGPRIGLLRHYPPRPIRLPKSYFDTTVPDTAPTISLVTPSFGQGRFLERTICSVLAQHYPALEYYIRDGGSTDDSIEILNRYDNHLAGWAAEPDEGQADAINRAFESTSGEIMGWLNSDDLLLPGALAYVAQYFSDHPEVDVVYGNRLMIDENDGQIGAWILPQHNDAVLTLADYVPQETLFWRRRIWDASGGRVDQSFSYALDWDLLLRFRAADARMAHLPRFLGAFRVHDQQKTSTALSVGLQEMGRLREQIHGRVVPTEEVLRRLRAYFFRHRLLHAWQRLLDRLPLETRAVQIGPQSIVPELPEVASTPAPRSGAAESPSAADDHPPTTEAGVLSDQASPL